MIVFAPLFLFSYHVMVILMSFSLIFLLKVQNSGLGLIRTMVDYVETSGCSNLYSFEL